MSVLPPVFKKSFADSFLRITKSIAQATSITITKAKRRAKENLFVSMIFSMINKIKNVNEIALFIYLSYNIFLNDSAAGISTSLMISARIFSALSSFSLAFEFSISLCPQTSANTALISSGVTKSLELTNA